MNKPFVPPLSDPLGGKPPATRVQQTSPWIPLIQAVAVAFITGVSQYFTAVAPLKAEVEKLKNAPVVPALAEQGPTESIPTGHQVVFLTDYLRSTLLWNRRDFKTDEAWDVKCKDVARATLRDMQYQIVDVKSDYAVRGFRDQKHLGVMCESENLTARLYGMAPKSQDDVWLREVSTFQALLKEKWDDLR